jgi:hypothetical protein
VAICVKKSWGSNKTCLAPPQFLRLSQVMK